MCLIYILCPYNYFMGEIETVCGISNNCLLKKNIIIEDKIVD